MPNSKQAWPGATQRSTTRMIAELGSTAAFAEQHGYFAFGHPEHHLQIEGFEISNDRP